MREILFRGKRKDNGEWVEGGYCVVPHPPVCFKEDLNNVDPDRHCIVCENPNTFSDWGMPRQMCMMDVLPETVGQWTGLTDKNGAKVFEGDIVKWGHIEGYREHPYRIAIVEMAPDIQYNAGVCVYRHGSFVYADKTDKAVEVISTIHDTPALLGEENKVWG